MWSLIATYLEAVKLKIIIVAIILVLGYVGYITIQLERYKSQVVKLQEIVTVLEGSLAICNGEKAQLQNYIDTTIQYYKERKCLDLKPGQELKKDELKLN